MAGDLSLTTNPILDPPAVLEPYEYEGKYFRTPKRDILPKPYTKPHPPICSRTMTTSSVHHAR